jgi:hypothetical protein
MRKTPSIFLSFSVSAFRRIMLSKNFNLNGTNGNEVHIIAISHEYNY